MCSDNEIKMARNIGAVCSVNKIKMARNYITGKYKNRPTMCSDNKIKMARNIGPVCRDNKIKMSRKINWKSTTQHNRPTVCSDNVIKMARNYITGRVHTTNTQAAQCRRYWTATTERRRAGS